MNENKKENLNHTSYKLDLDKLKQSTIEDNFAENRKTKQTKMTKEEKIIKNNKSKVEQTKEPKKENQRKSKKRKSKKKVKILLLVLLLIILGSSLAIGYKLSNDKKETKQKQEELTKEIASHYNEYVKTNKESNIYKLNNNKLEKVGKIGKEEELTLAKTTITYKDEYLKINTLEDEYYIYYKDIDKIEKLTTQDNRYQKYIVFNKNIITKENTKFYDKDNNLVYEIPKSFDLPIIINKKDIYGVEFNDRLLYIKKEDVSDIKDNQNTNLVNTKGIAVLNYHFFYDTSIDGDAAKCNQIICMSTTNLKKHLDYIKNNKIFTPSMEELEMYIDGYIQLPKSVVLTIDDGWRAGIGSNIMAEYEINATIFLMTKDYNPKKYLNEYIEVHSHGHDLHNPGVCPGGQGGAIKCLEKNKLLEDLSASRAKLNNSTVFCYPFYEYNNYSIEVLKEAGFTMAFGGYGEDGKLKVTPGSNKFKLPRYVIYSYTSVDNLKNYIG